ncbi:MAG: hypothetical protein ACFFDI_12920 [Promethearchaeota archaeon]
MKRGPKIKVTREEFIALCKRCKSRLELFDALKVSESTGYAYARRFRIKLGDFFGNERRPRDLPPELLQLYRNNPSIPVVDLIKDYNLSERTFYRKIDPKELRKPHTPKTNDLILKVSNTFVKNHSVLSTSSKLSLNRNRVSEILNEVGFTPRVSSSQYIKEHFSGECYIDFEPGLIEIINGVLLGDGYIECPSGIESVPTPVEYMDALEVPNRIQFSEESDNSDSVKSYNRAYSIMSRARVASLRLHKSVFEEVWLRDLAQRFQKHKCPVNILPPKDTIHFISKGLINFCWERWRWYVRNGEKGAPYDLPEQFNHQTLLGWMVGDGTTSRSTNGGTITLCTGSFSYADNKILANMLKAKIGLSSVRLPLRKDKLTDGSVVEYTVLAISRKDDINLFYEYLDEAPRDALRLAKELVPWKFDCNLRKFELYDKLNSFVDEDYLQTFLRLYEQFGIDPSERCYQLHLLFPWIYSLPKNTSDVFPDKLGR